MEKRVDLGSVIWGVLSVGTAVSISRLAWGKAMQWSGDAHVYLADELHAWADLLDSTGPALVGLGVLIFAGLLGYGLFRFLWAASVRVEHWEPYRDERQVLEGSNVARPALGSGGIVSTRRDIESNLNAYDRLEAFRDARSARIGNTVPIVASDVGR